MQWKEVGNFIKGNAGKGVALVGSLLTGNIPGAIAAGVSMVSSATGTDDPALALQTLRDDPASMVKLKELYYANEESVRNHLAEMTRIKLEDEQAEHHETQETVRGGDKSGDKFVRWTRPGMSWVSLVTAIVYGLKAEAPDVMILGAFLTLPWAYAGLRQVGKGVDSIALAMGAKK